MAPNSKSNLRFGAAVLLGILLIQGAWIVAIPPFHAMDEFDHAFRASGVASGQWRLSDPAQGGRGLLVEVPHELIDASVDQCESLPYIEAITCDGDGPGDTPGTVMATTSAANYVPVYYWVVGTASRPWEGSAALIAMRATSAMLCALVIMWSALCLRSWARGPWVWIGMLVGVTPTMVYSTSIVAPNGLEMAAGLLAWVSLSGLLTRAGEDGHSPRQDLSMLIGLGVASVLLVTLRTLGPLWLMLIVAGATLVFGHRALLAAVRRCLAGTIVISLLVIGGFALVTLWNRSSVQVPPGNVGGAIDSSWSQVFQYPGWILGAIGAFPFRNQPAPLVVHVLVLLVLLTLLAAATRSSRLRVRLGLGTLVASTILIPSLLVALTLEERGGLYQGRYALPFYVGIPLLAGYLADRSGWQVHPDDRRPQTLAVAMLVLAQAISVVAVQRGELVRNAELGISTPWQPASPITGLVLIIGFFACLVLSRVHEGAVTSATNRDPRAVG